MASSVDEELRDLVVPKKSFDKHVQCLVSWAILGAWTSGAQVGGVFTDIAGLVGRHPKSFFRARHLPTYLPTYTSSQKLS